MKYSSAGANHICEVLGKKGFQSYLVGGCVRDSILGVSPKDWDIATNATPDQVIASFDKVFPTGIDYGTVTVLVSGVPFEVTTFRADSPNYDGRRPDSVEFSDCI